MKRAERLYAIVDLLRANSPAPLSVSRMAAEFEVTHRTIERDLASLLAAGVPIHARPGRAGGYLIEREFSLPPLQFTPREAYALITGLAAMAGSPFTADAVTALRKVRAALPGKGAAATAAQVADTFFLQDAGPADTEAAAVLGRALHEGTVVVIDYLGDDGTLTHRAVEPLALLSVRGRWVVAGWCRLRQAIRGFRPDRVRGIELTDEPIPDRGAALADDLARWTFRSAQP